MPKKSAIFLLAVRFYVGYVWLVAGWEKIHSPLWVGTNSGSVLKGFINGSLSKTIGEHPDVQGWYAWFLSHVVLPHTAVWSQLIAYGEFLVGIALILGLLTGWAAFFGAFMNFNYLLAGTVSTNPILLILSLPLIIYRKTAGYIGLDRYISRKNLRS